MYPVKRNLGVVNPPQRLDLFYRLQGSIIPADHCYALYGAISRIAPQLHAEPDLGIQPINGRAVGSRVLALTPQSRLRLRLSPELVPLALRLAGKSLDLDGVKVRVGVPTPRLLAPYPDLYSRLVVIKGFTEPDGFVAAAARQLNAMGIDRSPTLVPVKGRTHPRAEGGTRSPVIRRTVRIRDRHIVGFAVVVGELDDDASIRLQSEGLGGRRRFGCGLFVPDREGG